MWVLYLCLSLLASQWYGIYGAGSDFGKHVPSARQDNRREDVSAPNERQLKDKQHQM